MMISFKRRSIPAMLAAAAMFGLTGVASAQESQPSQQELADQVRALQARIQQLESQVKPAPAAPVDSVTPAVDAAALDAAGRSQFLQSGSFTAGYKSNKFVIQSEDGKFSFTPTFQAQFRYVANFRDEAPEDSDGDSAYESGFEMRRVKFGGEGNFGDFTYKFVFATNRAGGTVFLEDVILKYALNEQWKIVGGQFKDPVHHEELVSSARQMAVERSLVNEVLGGGPLDRVQGIGAEYEAGPLWVTALYHDGANSDNTNFRDSGTGTGFNPTDYGVAARVEYTVFGDKKSYADFSAMNNTKDLLVIGAGGDITGSSASNLFFYTVDAQWENTTGLGVYGAALGRTTESHDDGGTTNDFGGLIQVSQMLDKNWEVFGRYGIIVLDDADDDTHEITAGVNYYFKGHNAKVSADLVYLPNGTEADTGVGLLDSNTESQFAVRVQFQLAY